MSEKSPVFGLAKDVFEALALAMSAETEEERRELFEVVHRGIVVFDDFLCEKFKFSRKPRGKYIKRRRVDNGTRNTDAGSS